MEGFPGQLLAGLPVNALQPQQANLQVNPLQTQQADLQALQQQHHLMLLLQQQAAQLRPPLGQPPLGQPPPQLCPLPRLDGLPPLPALPPLPPLGALGLGAGPCDLGRRPSGGREAAPSRQRAAGGGPDAAQARQGMPGGRGEEGRDAGPPAPAAAEKCHLHTKASKTCKFCQRHRQEVAQAQAERSRPSTPGGQKKAGAQRRDLLDGSLRIDKSFGLSPVLHQHITGSAHYKELLTLSSLREVINEVDQYVDSIEPYAKNSQMTPSPLFCCLFRTFSIGIDAADLLQLINHASNVYVRCLGILFVRFGLPADQLWPWLGEYALDDEEVWISKESDAEKMTIGELVEYVLNQDKYFSVVLPRLPMSVKRLVQEKLAPVPQYRKRARANSEIVKAYRREGTRVEALVDGQWLAGRTVDVVEDVPSRVKVLVRFQDDSEEAVHIGKVILGEATNRGRSRSRSRGRQGSGIDYTRDKGRTDRELIDEFRSRDRERAVCASGKDYARRPQGFKAACALPSEMGAASAQLIEQDTTVTSRGGAGRYGQSRYRTSPSPERMRKAPSLEHQAQMQKVFEKYGMAKSADGAGTHSDIDGPDFLRFG